jgi:hypothetical protein
MGCLLSAHVTLLRVSAVQGDSCLLESPVIMTQNLWLKLLRGKGSRMRTLIECILCCWNRRSMCCTRRDGAVFGCGLTEHGQLPFLRYSRSAVADASSSSSSDGEEEEDGAAGGTGSAQPRDEITIPTRLRLPFLQVHTPLPSGQQMHTWPFTRTHPLQPHGLGPACPLHECVWR